MTRSAKAQNKSGTSHTSQRAGNATSSKSADDSLTPAQKAARTKAANKAAQEERDRAALEVPSYPRNAMTKAKANAVWRGPGMGTRSGKRELSPVPDEAAQAKRSKISSKRDAQVDQSSSKESTQHHGQPVGSGKKSTAKLGNKGSLRLARHYRAPSVSLADASDTEFLAQSQVSGGANLALAYSKFSRDNDSDGSFKDDMQQSSDNPDIADMEAEYPESDDPQLDHLSGDSNALAGYLEQEQPLWSDNGDSKTSKKTYAKAQPRQHSTYLSRRSGKVPGNTTLSDSEASHGPCDLDDSREQHWKSKNRNPSRSRSAASTNSMSKSSKPVKGTDRGADKYSPLNHDSQGTKYYPDSTRIKGRHIKKEQVSIHRQQKQDYETPSWLEDEVMDQGGDISGPGSEGDSTNGDDGDISSSPWHASTNLVYTGREIELLKQRPDIRNLLHKTIDRLQGDIFFDNTYPNSEEKVQLVRNTLMKSARELQLRDVCKRLDSDMDYNDALGRIPWDRVSGWRTPFKKVASGHIMQSYNLTEDTTKRVDALLRGQSYIYPGDVLKTKGVEKTKPYMHPAIADTIWAMFFCKPNEKKKGFRALAVKHALRFLTNDDGKLETPDAMIAAAATGVHAALKEWLSGKHVSTDFTADNFTDIYATHIAVLNKLKERKPKVVNN